MAAKMQEKMRLELELREKLQTLALTDATVHNHLTMSRIGEWTFFEMLLHLAVYQAEENAGLRQKIEDLVSSMPIHHVPVPAQALKGERWCACGDELAPDEETRCGRCVQANER